MEEQQSHPPPPAGPLPSGNDERLQPHHRQAIEQSAIAENVRKARGYRSVTSHADLQRLGFGSTQCNVPTLVIPMYDVSGQIGLYHHRPDEPRVSSKRGRVVKYEFPHGSNMMIDVHPYIRAQIRNPTIPLFITEGVKKADSAISRGLCCIAVVGVWNWRGTNEFGGKTALPDWESIALKGREVNLAFDSDVMEKPSVYAALSRLAAFLHSRGGKVNYIYLPHGADGSKVGLDDYFAAGHSVEELMALATASLRAPLHPPCQQIGSEYEATKQGLVYNRVGPGGEVTPLRLTNFTACIIADVVVDDGAETRRFYKIEARVNGCTMVFDVAASVFPTLSWLHEHLGSNAVVSPGHMTKEHTRAAIQALSKEIVHQREYSHTGWVYEEGIGHVYLHGGGAIGANGAVTGDGVRVRFPEGLDGFRLPEPPGGQELAVAIRASLELLGLAPDEVVFPVFAQIYRAPLGPTDLTVWLVGPTGVFKSELAALAQQHFGAGLDARHLASWSSTENALEIYGFYLKDCLLVIDEFVPSGSSSDQQRDQRKAGRVIRAQGNNQGRGRLRQDGTPRPSRPPRGSILSTGEDLPQGQSLRARSLIAELAPNDVDVARLTSCQQDAADGMYAQSLAGYIQFQAARHTMMRQELETDVRELRARASGAGQHRRTPDAIATLASGLKQFLLFARHHGILTEAEAAALFERGWNALCASSQAQSAHQAANEPTRRFAELLRSTLGSKMAHIAGPEGREPENPAAWGWKQAADGNGWIAAGPRLGWVDGSDLYLDPDTAFKSANSMASEGERLTISSKTLSKRLHEQKRLLSIEESRGTLTVRRCLEGSARRPVWHLSARFLRDEGEESVASGLFHSTAANDFTVVSTAQAGGGEPSPAEATIGEPTWDEPTWDKPARDKLSTGERAPVDLVPVSWASGNACIP